MADFEQFKIDSDFTVLGQFKIDSNPSFALLWAVHCYFTELGQHIKSRKTSKPSPFDKRFENHAQDLAQILFNDSISGNQELSCQVNEYTSKVQSFLSFCNKFFWFVRQDKIYMIRIKTQKVSHTWGNNFKMVAFLTVLPRPVYRIQPKVYDGVFLRK